MSENEIENDPEKRLIVWIYMRGMATPIEVRDVKKLKWKKSGGSFASMEWEQHEDATVVLSTIVLDDIVAILCKDQNK